MSFEHEGLAFDLLDTPPPDFSEDTYRTLTAVECGDVLNAAKITKRGLDESTRTPFEVCQLRDVPILTFVNKLDREGRDPFDSFITMLTILKLPHSHATSPRLQILNSPARTGVGYWNGPVDPADSPQGLQP